MRLFFQRFSVVVALLAACSQTQTSVPSDAAPVEDSAPPLDLGAPAQDTPGPARDASPSIDVNPPEDVAPTEDLGPPDDVAQGDAVPLEESGMTDVPSPPRDVSSLLGVRCGSPAPPGTAHALSPPRFSGGACPRLVPGRNTLRTAHGDRTFILVVPSGADAGATPLPLMVGWHWLGGSANGFLSRGDLQSNADRLRFFAALPEKKGDLVIGVGSVRFDPVWPYLTYHSAGRVEEEAQFFDDMLACISEQFSIDADCVTSAGVSAGALWTTQLAQVRSERLASAIVLSGGIGPATTLGAGLVDARGWTPPRHILPMLVLWGGPIDQCALNFNTASRNLESAIIRRGHFVEECIHNCGHTVPPVDPAAGLGVIWQFMLDHPYWLGPGESPYLAAGLPSNAPSWCALGIGRARPRVGMCPDPTMSCPVPGL